MFTLPHLIWLLVIAAVIAAVLIVTRKLGVSHLAVQRVVFVLLVILKIFHLSLSMKELPDGGMVIDQTQLSFHLCSIMIYAKILINEGSPYGEQGKGHIRIVSACFASDEDGRNRLLRIRKVLLAMAAEKELI